MNIEFNLKRILKESRIPYFCAVICAMLFLCGISESLAQWSDQSPGVFPNIGSSGGALYFKKGVLWGGYKSVSYSLDTGKTWTLSLPSLASQGETVQNIDFADSLNGLIRTNNYLYLTVNGGATWSSQLAPGTIGSRYSAFAGVGTVVSLAREGAFTSMNGGATWAKTYSGSTPNIAAYNGAGTIAIFEGDHIIISNNSGQTWAAKPSDANVTDSYSFMWDPCDSNTLYLANEDYFRRTQNWSEVFVTNDRGNTWNSKIRRPWGYFNGAMSVVPEAAFFQTISNGIYRTLDYGVTWDSIGGPGNGGDTRWLCALTGNILVSVDQNGDVWRTDNSGGLPISPEAPLFLAPPPIVVSACNRDSLLLTMLAGHCKSYYIIKASISGPDSLLFHVRPTRSLPNMITNGARDTLKIDFDPKNQTGSFTDTVHVLWQGQIGPARDTSFIIRITVNPAPLQYVFIPPVVVFDTVSPCGGIRDTSVLVKNIGCDSIRISNILYPLGSSFSVDSLKLPVILPPDSTLRVRYHFHPVSPGFINALDAFTADWKGLQLIQNLSLNGRGTTTGFAGIAADSILDFDTISACSPFRDSSVTITNLGCDTMRITSATSNLGAGFSRDPLNFPILIPPGHTGIIRFHFHPPAVGSFNTTVTFSIDWGGYAGTTRDVLLRGSSNRSVAGPLVADTLVSYGVESVCHPFSDTSVTIRNRSCDTLRILSGPGSLGGDFGMDKVSYPIVLPPDSSISITFHLLRSGVGSYKGKATFVTSREGITQNLSLSISGTISSSNAGPAVANSTVDFGTLTSCNPLKDTSITLTNQGCDTLRILSGPGQIGQGYSMDQLQLPIILPPDSSVVLHFHFISHGVGNFQAHPHFLTWRSGVTDSIDLDLNSIGIEGATLLSLSVPDFSFAPLSFCSIDSAECSFTNLGCDTLFVTPQGNSGDPDFLAAGGPEKALMNGDTVHIKIYFQPQQHGQRAGTYRISYRTRFGVMRDTILPITGIVFPGKRALEQSLKAIDFGTTTLCSNPDSSFVLTNNGCDTLSITSADLDDPGFLLAGVTFPIIVRPGQTLSVPITTTLDTVGRKPVSQGTLTLFNTGDSSLTPILLRHGYSYPKYYPLRFEIPPGGHHAGDTAKVRLVADSLPIGLTTVQASLTSTNPDMLTYLFTKSANTVTSSGNTYTFTGNPVIAPGGLLAELSYKVYLSRDSISTFALSGVHFNSYDADFENCIARSSASPTDSILYAFACGEPTIQRAMNDDLASRLLGIYPNPAHEQIVLDLHTNQTELCTISISDSKGNTVKSYKCIHPGGRSGVQLDVSSLPSAAYFLTIDAGSAPLRATFVKKK